MNKPKKQKLKTVKNDIRPEKSSAFFPKVWPLFLENYPDAHCALLHRNAFELLVATILSAQCTDERVNKVTPALFELYPDPESMANAPILDLETLIRSTNFYKNKAKNLKACAARLVDVHGGQVPSTMEELVQLAGVGRKTANVVLGNAFRIAHGIVVDTHVGRLSQRLGWTSHIDPVKIEQDLQKIAPKDTWIDLPHQLIFHGRAICKARRPLCEKCFLFDRCPKKGV